MCQAIGTTRARGRTSTSSATMRYFIRNRRLGFRCGGIDLQYFDAHSGAAERLRTGPVDNLRKVLISFTIVALIELPKVDMDINPRFFGALVALTTLLFCCEVEAPLAAVPEPSSGDRCRAGFEEGCRLQCERGVELSAERASTVLRSVQERYGEVKSIAANFKQYSFLAALDAEEESGGEVWFERPGKMKWHYSTPEEQVFLLSGDSIWFYQAAEKQVLVDRVEGVMLSEMPVAFLMGIGKLDQSFELKSGCEEGDNYLLELLPRAKTTLAGGKDSAVDRRVTALALLVSKRSFIPGAAEITDPSGNRTRIVLGGVTTNGKIPENTFTPRFPAGVDLIDKRTALSGANAGREGEGRVVYE